MRIISRNQIRINIWVDFLMIMGYGAIFGIAQPYYRYSKGELSGLGVIAYLLLFAMMVFVTFALGFHLGNLATIQHLEKEAEKKKEQNRWGI